MLLVWHFKGAWHTLEAMLNSHDDAPPMQANIPTPLPIVRLSVLAILDRSFEFIRSHWRTYSIPIAVVVIPFYLIQLWLITQIGDLLPSTTLNSPTEISSEQVQVILFGMGYLVLLVIEAIISGVFSQGLVTWLASEHLHQAQPSLRQALQSILPRSLNLLIAYFLFFGMIIALTILGILTAGILIGWGFLGFALYLGIAVSSLLIPIFMLENVEPIVGFSRAWQMGKASFRGIFALTLLLTTLTLVAEFGVLTLLDWLAMFLGLPIDGTTLLIVDTVLHSVILVFATQLQSIAPMLAYYDIRAQLEGLPLAMRLLKSPNARPQDLPSVTFRSPLITRQDLARMMWLTLFMILIMLLIFTLNSTLGTQPTIGVPSV